VVNGPVTVTDLRKGLAQQLPDYMLPAHFIVLERLPLNPAGKIDRKALPTLANAQRLSDDLGGAPKGEREQALAQVWCEVLGLENIGRDDNFFASGGDSIKALQIVSRARKTGWKLEVRDLFTHSSISKLAPRLTLINEYLIADTEKPEGEVALSPIQQHFFQRHGRDYHHFNQAFLLEADAVDVEKLKLALRLVCAQHDSFRLRFKQQNRQWQQAYAETETFEFTVQALLSLQDLSAQAAKVQQSFDLSNGVLFKVVYYQLPEKCYLLLVAHHLIIDAVSWRILMEDLNEAYEQGEQWQAPAPTLSMKVWNRYCQLQGKKIIEEQQSYWRQQTITPNMDGYDVDYASLDSIKIELDVTHSELFLTGVYQAYATEANDLLLTALLLAYNQWTQESAFSLILEGHGRDVLEGADVSRTIGWFTTRYPVVLHYEQAKDLGYTIKSVKENLRAIPNKGVGYGLLRYRVPELETHLFKDPAISFNYLGQFGEQQQGHFSIANEAIGDIISPEASSPYLIEFVGKHVAGRLTFEIAYSRTIYKKQQIDDFAQSFKDALIKIIAHTANAETQSLSPSDIDYDGFDISQLDDFMAQL
jgi:non-ribosomal peptide synthase protein (TIGR01720 family)